MQSTITQYANLAKDKLVHIVKDTGTAYLLQIHQSELSHKVGTRFICPKDEFNKWYKDAGSYNKVA